MTPVRTSLLLSLLLLLPASPARAKHLVTLAPVKDTKIDGVLPVTAPEARCAAVGEQTGWLAFGHRPKRQDAHVSLFRLDAQGKPGAAPAATLKLPSPPALAKMPNYPLALAFHPKLPILYVWQDLVVPATPVLPPATFKDFDHLLIYALDKPKPELLLSLCRGPEYAYGKLGGAVAVDATGRHLYVPSLQDPKINNAPLAGRFVLDADGLPVLGDPAARKGAVPAQAARIAAFNADKAAGKPILPQQRTPNEHAYVSPVSAYGYGGGFVPVSGDVAIIGGVHCLITWNPAARKVQLAAVFLESTDRTYKVVGHPTLPVVYAAPPGLDFAYRMYHADGYLTLLPQKAVFKDANLLSPPAVLGRANKVVFGGRNRVYAVGLTKDGDFTDERTQMVVNNPEAEALVYAPKFDLLYVAVEVSK